ncbi:MAG: hypothetical protein KDE22_01150, partial [Rhodobacterales bacterium]|nr:hypothetical protein [Rhodobacterales bacterium]
SGSMAAPEPAPQAAPSGAMPEAQPTDGPMTAVAPQEPPPPVSVPLRFAWNQPVAAAVFRRAGGLWVVFDRPSNPNLEALRQAGGRAFRDVRRVPTGNGTVLRFETNGELNPALLRDGLTWIVDLRPRPITAHTDIESNAQPDSPIGARIFLPIPEPGQPILVADPEAGDNLIVVPVIPLGHGVKNGYAYPQLDVLPSAQGIVLQPRVDDLRVRSLRQGVEITAGTQLQISAVSAEQAAESKLKTLHPLTRTMDLERWRGADLADVNERRQELRAAVAAARGETDIEQGRLDLARFLLANALSAEALGVLRVVGADRPEAAGEPEVRTLRAAANFLMGRYADAQADMADPVVDPFDEGRFWRAALRAAEGDKAEAAPDLKRTGAITRPYPNALKVPLGLLVAESMIEVGEVTQAAEYLAALGAADLSEDQALEHAYVTGRLQELQGDFDGAVKTWEEVIAGDHRPSRAKAAMARAELLLKQRKITRPEAIAEMEALRFAWRGDDFEFNLLRRLGTLYLAENDPRNGLRTLRQAVTHFRDHPAVDTVAQQMTDAFHDLYLEDKADVLAPVTAIALYDEFKELTPAGEQGDEMIRKLADRLVAVDLLDRAADLLDNQVKFRLKGEQKARVGARLALVRIMNRQPDLAVAALDASAPDKTGDAALPDDLKAQRRHLRARALADLAQDGQALALLNDDATTDANLLRSDILWQVQDWSNAARALRQTLRDEGIRPNQALDDRAARRVLNLGVALTLAGNERAVSRLRRDYGPAMDQTLFRDAFRLVADTPEPGPTDVRRLSELVSEAENFRGFMGAYRDRLRDGRLSAIN